VSVTSIVDVEAALLRSVTTEELGFVSRLIDLTETDILSRLPGYDLNPVSTETVTVTGTYEEVLTLPRYPVTAVSAVSVNGVALAAGGWSVTTKGRLSVLGSAPGYWGGPTSTVTVTYSHGQAVESPLVLLIADLVASRLADAGRQGVRSMSVDSDAYSEAYGPPNTPVPGDVKRLAPYRRASIGSIVLTSR
jgi:hypothetical protein